VVKVHFGIWIKKFSEIESRTGRVFVHADDDAMGSQSLAFDASREHSGARRIFLARLLPLRPAPHMINSVCSQLPKKRRRTEVSAPLQQLAALMPSAGRIL
jgi:hypothetical protein